jgi:FKBP-type peptidyl-prolyl cis-trans isomerase
LLPHATLVIAITKIQVGRIVDIFSVMSRFAIVFITLVASACAKQAGPRAELRIEDLTVGTGAVAEERKCVYAHYTGWLASGKEFDASRDRYGAGAPIRFVLGTGRVIAGWDQGFVGMRVGGKRKLFVPSRLGYGTRGAGEAIPPNADLVFEVELLDVTPTCPTRR